MLNNYVSAYGNTIVSEVDTKLDYLIWKFFYERMNTDLYKRPIDLEALTDFSISSFRQNNKKQFISLITEEVLLEVWLEGLPNNEYLRGEEVCNPILCYKEYWK